MNLIQPIEEPKDGGASCADICFPHDPDINYLAITEDYKEQMASVKVTLDEALGIEKQTREQSASDVWQSERNRRITASNFGRIMLRKAAVTQKFIDSLLNKKAFTSASTSYGISNEKVARNMYRKKTGNHVHDCGLLINPNFPCIGATPDGKVCHEGQAGILEIKCPFSVRDMKIKDAVNSDKVRDFFLESVEGEICLKKNHNYWYQVQGQLLVSGAKFCDFVTYTRQDLNIIRVLPEKETMEEILSRMCNMYEKLFC